MQAEMSKVISMRVPSCLTELTALDRTLKRRVGDTLAYFGHLLASRGPAEAINGCLNHLCESVQDLRSLTCHVTRALRETNGFKA